MAHFLLAKDKIGHFGAGFAVGLLGGLAGSPEAGANIAVLVGLGKELLYDERTPGRVVDGWDAFMTAWGGTVGALAGTIVRRIVSS